MNHSPSLRFFLLSWIFTHGIIYAFSVKSMKRRSSEMREAPDNVVDKEKFIEAINVVQMELGMPKENKADGDYTYAIGKTEAKLPVVFASGLGFAEAAKENDVGLVLVTEVSKQVSELGIQPFDTIVKISAQGGNGYEKITNSLGIEQTAEAFSGAVYHAMEHDLIDIDLVLNRLIKLNYMPPEEKK
mmetsp:Transcript_27454/g.41576  ORF Transcript_27454/g.41576 Transcript_27454/m.41576 type:complete len:187 (-) Transcript_27454:151-711(-)